MKPSILRKALGFSLVEVVLAIGVVAFAVLTVFGLLSVANDTNKRARDEGFAAQLAHNEFQRIRSLSSQNFPTSAYISRYFDISLTDLGTTLVPNAVYQMQIAITPYPTPFATPTPTPPPTTPAQFLFNAEVRYPASAPVANQTVSRFTTLMVAP